MPRAWVRIGAGERNLALEGEVFNGAVQACESTTRCQVTKKGPGADGVCFGVEPDSAGEAFTACMASKGYAAEMSHDCKQRHGAPGDRP